MKIKTFPLQFTEQKLDEIGRLAKNSKKQFILDAIDEKIEKEEK